jgi:predicted PurR-regulated permease PerM
VAAPPLLPPPVVTLVGLAAAVIVLGGVQGAQGLAGPIFLAFVLSIAVYPLQAWLRRKRLPGWLALTVTVLVTYAALTAFAGALLLSVLQFAGQVPRYSAELNSLVDQGEQLLRDVGVDQDQINDVLRQFDISQALSVAVGIVQTFASLLTNLAFVLALLFFVLIDAGGVHTKLAAVRAVRPRVAKAMHGFSHGVRQYLVVTAIFGAVVASLDVVLLMLLGVPLPCCGACSPSWRASCRRSGSWWGWCRPWSSACSTGDRRRGCSSWPATSSSTTRSTTSSSRSSSATPSA